MQEAGLMNLLRTLLIILLIYYAFKFLAKLFAPYIMKRVIIKMQDKKGEQATSKIKEGETVIDKKPNKSRQSKNEVGDYVDFEEID